MENYLKIFYFLILVKTIKASSNQFGILAAESASDKENYCIIFFQEFVHLPEEKSSAELHPIADARDVDWCSSSKFDSKSKILLLTKNNCSVSEQASNVQEQGGRGILFITASSNTIFPVNESLAKDINITVGLISENSVVRLHSMGNMERMEVSGRMFSPANLNFDYSLLLIWFIAMFTVAVGSYWSGKIRFEIYSKEISVLPAAVEGSRSKPSQTGEESSLNVSPYYVGFMVLFMGGMLLLLYFFFNYLVYVIIFMFVLASALAIYGCLQPLVLKVPERFCMVFDVHIGSYICDFDFRQILLVIFSCAVSLTWLVIRKQRYSWILQDILGVAFCIHMLKSIRLPSLKICTVLLVLLFFYDIFFVFVTPYLTHKGESVMEEVATGGNTNESLPMVLKVMHFKFNALAVCYEQYSILGFGDILVPGLLISYCHGFDLITNKRRMYFPITVATYGIGLLITFIGLFLMNTAQPALLYLVPTTLIPPFIIGWCRGELRLLWKGFKVVKRRNVANVPVAAEVVAEVETNDGINNDNNSVITSPPSSSSKKMGEKKHLLR